MVQTATLWNSLEIVKLIIAMSTPMIVLILGYVINKNIKAIEQKHWENQKITEWKIKVFDELSPKINDVFCYMLHIGNWKELTPPDVVQTKRDLDKKMHTSAALFSKELAKCYDSFMNNCFMSYRGWGKDAAIRVAKTEHKNAARTDWNNKWDDLFVDKDQCEIEFIVQESYSELMTMFSKEIGIGLNGNNHTMVRNKLFNWWS